jgi:hypothetical protein
MGNRYYQQQFIHQRAPLIQNKYALNVMLKIKTEGFADAGSLAFTIRPKTRISNEINFVLCQSCFWCASYLSSQTLSRMATAEDSLLVKCPSCLEGSIESIPIAENENYRFAYDTKRGAVMEFFR